MKFLGIKKPHLIRMIPLFLIVVLVVLLLIRNPKITENFTSDEQDLRETVATIYDEFYATIYSSIIDEYHQKLVVYQCEDIIANTRLVEYGKKATILDLGCGTGSHVQEFGKSYAVTGLDFSRAMLEKARAKGSSPNIRFLLGDFDHPDNMRSHHYSHITCFYFSFYYSKNHARLAKNCHRWLKSGGYLIVELVDRDKFDPVLQAANPFPLLSMQSYSKSRVTRSKIHFNNLSYESNFRLEDATSALFEESVTFTKTGRVLVNRHKFNMPNHEDLCALISKQGFHLERITNMGEVNVSYHYLCYFKKI